MEQPSDEPITTPKRSLCESCRHAYAMPGGAVFIGGKIYAQMYCAVKTIGITNSTIRECDEHFPTEVA